MNRISINKVDDKTINVECPYHPDAIREFRNANGKFNNVWAFDIRDEVNVKNILVDVFGTYDSDCCATVDLRLSFEEADIANKEAIYYAGRQIARAWGRDSGAKLGPGVVVVEGRAPRSGGSAKNWTTLIDVGTVLEVRDIPKPAAQYLVEFPPHGLKVSVVGGGSNDLDALKNRRQNLLDELAEVETMIELTTQKAGVGSEEE